ncbi:MAG TPA: 2'-5' RNA ligase family protein [Candidatus Eisenbacteria bacterium]|nr:2'-5' RNA ligase family protein [Candidatus Eisenbacteria bacterium]
MSVPRESALIVPAPEAETLVGAWRERYDDSAQTGVPAHLTLLYPFLSPEDIGHADLRRLAALFASAPATPYRLTAVRRFSRGVLYLAPEPEPFFRDLTNRTWALFPHRPPYGGAFPSIVPHLTIAQSPDHALLDEVEAAVVGGLPISAHAREVWLMLQGDDDRWRAGHRFPLGSPPP